MSKKLLLILPYYGRLPVYFSLYVASIQNSGVTVLLVTDIKNVPSVPRLKVLGLTLQEVEALARRKLRVEIHLNHPRRLCDLKPMYGKIFEDYLADYDYWGFGDCDLVYGRALDGIVTSAVEKGFEVISLRKHWTTGSFCLLRNNETCRLLFSRADNWKEVACLTQDMFVDFDETGGKWHRQLETGAMTMEDCRKHADSFSAVVWRSTDIKVYHEDHAWETDLKGQVVHVQANGVMTVNQHEVPIVHFVNCKGRRYFRCPRIPDPVPTEYWVTDTGFYLSKSAWSVHVVIASWRRFKALCASVVQNGLRHWVKRFF